MNDNTPSNGEPSETGLASNGSDETGFGGDLRAHFEADPTPPHRDGFWGSLQEDLHFEATTERIDVVLPDDVTSLTAATDIAPSGAAPAGDTRSGADATDDLAARRRRGWRSRMPLVGAAAACLVLLLGGLLVTRTRDRDRTTTTAATVGTQDTANDLPDPVVNPLLTVAEDMTSTDLEPLFTVRSSSLNDFYNRLTSLSIMDSLGGWSERADFASPPDLPSGTSDDLSVLEQATYTISEPEAASLLPVPAFTFRVDSTEAESIQFSPENGSWLVDRHRPVAEYTAVEYTANFSHLDSLWLWPVDRVGSDGIPPVDPINLQLPDEIADQVSFRAAELTADAVADVDRAMSLESFFRTEFVLDLDERGASGQRAYADFLDRRTGNPEHFAGTFSAMLRSLGVPARVAVGFLPGEQVEGDAELRLVRRRDAHAWSEVLLNGVWRRFDPTPGRGRSTSMPELPAASRDHWHAPYAIYDCRTGAYQPLSPSTLDPLGIHSHQDGVIHIHPFFDSAAGENAVFGIFLESIGAELNGSGLASLEGSLPTTATCDGQEAVLHLRKWQFDFMMGDVPPEIVVDDIGSVRFENDREVYLLALAPVDGDLPAFPADRLQVLDDVTGPITPTGG